MDSLIFVTGNKGKAEEAKAILGVGVETQEADLDEIQGTLEEIVQRKAEDAFAQIGKPLIVDDVGFYVDEWHDFPGPYIKFMLPMGNEKILRMVEGFENRGVTIKCGLGYHDGTQVHTFIGEVHGQIPKEIRGEAGFGFDPIFIPDGHQKTYAEMSFDEKNQVSHRAKALDLLKKHLDSV